jgi:hypothetical protein
MNWLITSRISTHCKYYFPKPGANIFGNSSINITDASGTAQLRLDADVSDYRICTARENCGEIVGVVSNFFQQQILPRLRTDFPCANKYQQTGSKQYQR